MASERGSVLMLMPAAVLIVVILGAISLDRAIAFGAQRELVARAQAVANDAAGTGLDVDALRADGIVRLDPDRVGAAVSAGTATAAGDASVSWAIEGDTVVVVRLRRAVSYVFSPAVPGGDHDVEITATARAELRRR